MAKLLLGLRVLSFLESSLPDQLNLNPTIFLGRDESQFPRLLNEHGTDLHSNRELGNNLSKEVMLDSTSDCPNYCGEKIQ